MLKMIAHFFTVLFLFIITGCTVTSSTQGPNALSSPLDAKKLRIGVSTNAPPLIYKMNGEIQGLEVDFAHQLSDYLGREAIFIELPWAKQIESLESGEIDIIMSGMTITGKRSYRVNFSTPYLKSGQIMLIRLEDKRRFIQGIYSVMGSNHTVGTVKGTTGDFYVSQTLHGLDVKNFTTSKKAVLSMIDKEIDVLIYDAPMVCHYAAIYENAKLAPVLNLLTSESLAWAVNKNDVELLNQVNDFIELSKENKTLQQTITNRIPYL